jgi:hypothetical protein
MAVTLVATLGGCVATVPTGGSGGGVGATKASYTPAEQKLRQESKLFSKSAAQGCVAGAIGGALIGALIADKKNRGRGVAIGAAAGCAVGVGANAYVQANRQKYRTEEARINATIEAVRADNQRLSRLIATTQTVIADDKRKIAQVKAASRDKQMSAAQARAELARVKENRRILDNTITDVKNKENEWVRISKLERQSGANTARLDSEIRVLKGKVAALEAEAALMDREIAATPAAA